MVKIEIDTKTLKEAINRLSVEEKVQMLKSLQRKSLRKESNTSQLNKARRLISQMSFSDKVKLVKELRRDTWKTEMEALWKRIKQRRKKYRISDKEISGEIEKARNEFYANRR